MTAPSDEPSSDSQDTGVAQSDSSDTGDAAPQAGQSEGTYDPTDFD